MLRNDRKCKYNFIIIAGPVSLPIRHGHRVYGQLRCIRKLQMTPVSHRGHLLNHNDTQVSSGGWSRNWMGRQYQTRCQRQWRSLGITHNSLRHVHEHLRFRKLVVYCLVVYCNTKYIGHCNDEFVKTNFQEFAFMNLCQWVDLSMKSILGLHTSGSVHVFIKMNENYVS